MNKLNNKGFTLIEVLAVIAIIAVLGIISVPNILSVINTGRDNSYNIMVSDIKIASQNLFEELENSDEFISDYNLNGKTTNIVVNNSATNKKTITINLQALVSNGFLSGTSNNSNSNKNNKVIINPKNKNDIGMCNITINRIVDSNYKVTYSIVNNSTSNISCPTTVEYNNS